MDSAPDIFDQIALVQAHRHFVESLRSSTTEDRNFGILMLTCSQDGVPWSDIDKQIEFHTERLGWWTPEVKRAYVAWRDAAILIGYDPRWSSLDRALTKFYSDVVMDITMFHVKHGRYPHFEECISLPSNPYNGSSEVARVGSATTGHGWSYDESTGRVYVVLPPGVCCRSMPERQIERLRL